MFCGEVPSRSIRRNLRGGQQGFSGPVILWRRPNPVGAFRETPLRRPPRCLHQSEKIGHSLLCVSVTGGCGRNSQEAVTNLHRRLWPTFTASCGEWSQQAVADLHRRLRLKFTASCEGQRNRLCSWNDGGKVRLQCLAARCIGHRAHHIIRAWRKR